MTWRSPIASSSADCTLAGARLISSASSEVVEDRPGLELEAAILRALDLGAGEVRRQQVRRELDAVEIGFQRRQRA